MEQQFHVPYVNGKGNSFKKEYLSPPFPSKRCKDSNYAATDERNNLNKNDISQELLNSSLEPLSLENVSTDNHDRVNSNPESFDIAMGTLMALVENIFDVLFVWIFDQIQSNPLDKIENNAIGGYLESLNTNELETLATKAVAAGANPIKLQEAFITAQNTGNWNDLELEIASVLGPEAVGGQSKSLPSPSNLNNMQWNSLKLNTTDLQMASDYVSEAILILDFLSIEGKY
ncbi:unnamed protein product [Lepeophtheirus salmonis]|uniref:(salmon louse) hypothetical protein n=1 Tax=Lepeophtheirus salmonis TaxID=72036 RepID=A0A7R8H2Q9_LEPSM|nr:unnamed protein product [Lepeophtheirus salmonis]CAF2817696.1 unnamed protein product [Lepeophtheirus salmonis]